MKDNHSKVGRVLFSIFLMFSLFGCAGVKGRPEPTVASITGGTETFRRNQIVHAPSGKVVSFGALMDHVSSFDVIFVGEVHTNAEHHLIQVQILQALLEKVPDLMIGIEFIPRNMQPYLDRYVMEDETEEAFLETVDWKKTWGYPYHLYRPLFLAARREKAPVFALNAPRDIVRKVAREGLASLNQQERSMIPAGLDLSDEAHRDYVHEVYHRHDHSTLRNFEYFYQAQVVRDETMAHSIAEAIGNRGGKMLVFSGNGHIARKFGIPARTLRRIPVSVVTVVPYPLHGAVTVEEDLADFIWLTSP